MPHPNDHDDQTLAAVIGDREQIVCRTVRDAEINSDDGDGDQLMIRRQDNGGGMLQHLPPKSFFLSLSEHSMFNGSAFINRKKSYKGNVGPNSAAKPNPIVSQLPRIGKSKVSLMISLPQPQNLVDATTAAKSPRLFQKPRELSQLAAEPTSPEVSCTGRVRSKRDGGRHLHKLIRSEKLPDKKLSWLVSGFRAVLGGKPRAKPRPSVEAEIVQRSNGGRLHDINVNETSPNSRSPPADRSLRIMERFTSSRRLE